MNEDKLTIQQAIVKFCEAKRDYLKERLPASAPLYVNDDDIAEILSFADAQAEKIWTGFLSFYSEAFLVSLTGPMSVELCPWCIIQKDGVESKTFDCELYGHGNRDDRDMERLFEFRKITSLVYLHVDSQHFSLYLHKVLLSLDEKVRAGKDRVGSGSVKFSRSIGENWWKREG